MLHCGQSRASTYWQTSHCVTCAFFCGSDSDERAKTTDVLLRLRFLLPLDGDVTAFTSVIARIRAETPNLLTAGNDRQR